MARPTKALIDLNALKHNYRIAQSLSEGGQCLAVIKANAYGHGAIEIAKALAPLAPAFGVACIEEADELRRSGITTPILLLEGAFSMDEIAVAAEKNYWLMVTTDKQAADIINAELYQQVHVWLKVDTGMHRLGVLAKDVNRMHKALKASKNVAEEVVIATHLVCADEADDPLTLRQITEIKSVCGALNESCSIANSAALLAWPAAKAEWNRPGYMLYGNSPLLFTNQAASQLIHVMTLRSAVIALRDVAIGETVGYGAAWRAERPSRIATVAIGYGDGYPRHATNGTPVLVGGQRAKLAGRVSMDMITVDVTDLTVAIGDEVILWGQALSANEVASWAGTIGYELLTRMPLRTPRVFVNA
jgi:alanine racemase